MLRLEVTDTGIGIAPAHQEAIFEEFFQVEGPFQKGVQGTGLGLPLTRRLAEALGGKVWMHSEPGVGSTFGVDLPTIHPSVAAELEKAEEAPAAPRQGMLALIIDDDAPSRFVLSRPLTEAGFEVIEAGTAAEGQELAFQRQPSIIFLDLRLPDRWGTEVLETLQADLRTRATPIIVYTAQPLTPALHPAPRFRGGGDLQGPPVARRHARRPAPRPQPRRLRDSGVVRWLSTSWSSTTARRSGTASPGR